MKAIVKTVFCDKFTGKQYNPGEVINIDDNSRLDDLESRGLAERLEKVETVVEKKATKKVSRK